MHSLNTQLCVAIIASGVDCYKACLYNRSTVADHSAEKKSCMNTLDCSTVESVPRLLLVFFKIAKIVHKSTDFVVSFLFCKAQNYGQMQVYRHWMYEMNAIMYLETFLVCFRAVRKLWLASHIPKYVHVSWTFHFRIFVHIYFKIWNIHVHVYNSNLQGACSSTTNQITPLLPKA